MTAKVRNPYCIRIKILNPSSTQGVYANTFSIQKNATYRHTCNLS